jgi:threonine dehydrogenase-like Zn-dependent dehydrogenase
MVDEGSRRLNSRSVNAIVVGPGHPAPEMVALPDAQPADGEALVEGVLVGVCATDRHVIERASALTKDLVLGHESLGRIAAAPSDSGLAVGDLVVGLVRRPCPEHCASCNVGELDRCRSQPPVERGISRADGFAAEWWTSPPRYLCPVPPALSEAGILIEPMSSIMKGLRRLHYDKHVQSSRRALVLGAGTIGVLSSAALRESHFDVDVADPYVDHRRQRLVTTLGARFLSSSARPRQYDLVVEASGTNDGFEQGFNAVGPNGDILVLGIPPAAAARIGEVERLVMDNVTTVFSVSATPDDHRRAASLLSEIDVDLFAAMVQQEFPLAQYREAMVASNTGSPKTVVRVNA